MADEWAAEWELLRPMIVDSPAEVLPDLADLVRRMLAARGHPVDESDPAAAGDELSAQYLQARAAADAAGAGQAGTAEVADAIAQLRELYDVLTRGDA